MKMKNLLFAFGLLSIGSMAYAQVAYQVPTTPWNYIYNGDQALYTVGEEAELDGTWKFKGQLWDGTAPGDPAGKPGGAGTFTTADGVDYLRIQDVGHPKDHGMDDYHRKPSFSHNLTLDGVDLTTMILDVGSTLAFRIKVPLDDGTAGIDMLYMPDLYWPDGSAADNVLPYPMEGDGYGIAEGMGMVTIVQNDANTDVGDGAIGFSLMTTNDHDTIATLGEGLYMNSLYGPELEKRPELFTNSKDVLTESNDLGILTNGPYPNNATNRVLCTPTVWNEFWVQFTADASGTGTHQVKIWLNGDVANPQTFLVTGSHKDHEAYPYLWLGLINSDDIGAMDIDYVAFSSSLIDPVAAGGGNTGVINDATAKVKLYPNPIDDSNVLNVTLPSVNSKVTIFDSVGRKMVERISTSTEARFNVSDYARGVYFVQVDNGPALKFVK